MEVHFAPDVQARLEKLANETGRPTSEMLDGRYDDLKSGRVKPIDGEAFFDSLRRREEELLKNR